MSVIRLVDEVGNEVAICQSFEVSTDDLVDVTTFGSMGQAWIAPKVDVTMKVTKFKTPMPQLAETAHRMEMIAQLNRTIVALVRMMGGAVKISRAEADKADTSTLTVEEVLEGVMLRVDE